ARLSAFRNVWWSLANEFDFMTDKPKANHRGNKEFADWDRFFSILETEDPFHRMRGIHNGKVWYDHTKAWVTHASLQTSDMNAGVTFRAKYQKPVIYDECKYEGNVTQGWGRLTGREMTQRFWLGTMGGCYVGHGETFTNPEDILWWSKGGVLHGESPQRIQWLKDFMAKAPPFHELQPLGDDKGRFVLAKAGEYYLLYALARKAASLQLPGAHPWKVDAIDPWEMKEWAVGSAQPGEFKTPSAHDDLAYRFTPYAPGEKLRPESHPTADVTEGVPPLKVNFTSGAEAEAKWDFGDGTTSAERNPAHTFDKPGLYSVALTVGDKDGGSARSQLLITVDRNSAEPIVRAGFASDETPALQLRGTAKRGNDGTLRLPDGAPWGWVKVGERPVADLAGLRSFTIRGWLKPESLTTGSGGNRILFCLQRDHSGIDLVCHSDGSLRLAVNTWPDRVKNDSSPGKLVAGKWTRFAVTYDSTKAADNVAWYFSAPLNGPLTLDRRTTYNAGPVAADIGALTIGNFNDTMQNSGFDRQFRGEIRALEIYGSRVGSGGVLAEQKLKL
ncbi:MAG: PKD domain-containing protein, partial [Chthoniobacteraceae bacterium]